MLTSYEYNNNLSIVLLKQKGNWFTGKLHGYTVHQQYPTL